MKFVNNKDDETSGLLTDVALEQTSKTTSSHREAVDASQYVEDHIEVAGIPGPPKELTTPEELVSWTERRQKELGPRYIQELEHQLRYGSEKARREIALAGMKALGLAEQRQGNTSVPGIVVKVQLDQLPWAAKKQLEKTTVDGEVVPNGSTEE